MNMKKLNTFLAAVAFLFTSLVQAQEVTVMTEDMTVEPGSEYLLNVMVSDFEVISSVQFAMFWDSEVLQYEGVQNFGLPDMSQNGNFFFDTEFPGKLRFSYIDPDPYFNGVTVDDNSTIFSIRFTAIGNPGQTTAFDITDDPWAVSPMPVEIYNTTGEISANIQTGTITMAGANAASESLTNDFVLHQNSPNPFADVTNITFELNRTSNTSLRIYDHAGKVVFEQSKTYASGSHTIQIARDLFQSAGSYFYTLETEKASATRQLVVR